MKRLLLILFCLPLFFTTCKKEDGQAPYVIDNPSVTTQIFLEVYGFENLDGNLVIAIDNSSEQFDSDTECYIDTTIDVVFTDMTIIIDGINSGAYAVSIFHDEDEDSKLDLGLLDIPQEGFGFSNNPDIGFSKPEFNDCKFVIEEGQSIAVPIILVYL